MKQIVITQTIAVRTWTMLRSGIVENEQPLRLAKAIVSLSFRAGRAYHKIFYGCHGLGYIQTEVNAQMHKLSRSSADLRANNEKVSP